MMSRQPRRAAGKKALQAIKKGRVSKKSDVRSVLGDITNKALQSAEDVVPAKRRDITNKKQPACPAVQVAMKRLSCSDDNSDGGVETSQVCWKDIDAAEAKDPLFSAEYATDIYAYMREREVHFMVPAYMTSQQDISEPMRTILVDWLIEVQENFELFHETLYLSVQITDRYLSLRDVKREYLQLVGATSMLIASKFEELSPPLVDDFLYLCDDAYTHDELVKMEQDILKALDYDINIPVAYRFLRRLARAAEASMETHTLARYIAESTLQEYAFITERPSYVAACSMYLALRMKQLGPWTPTLQHYSGYDVPEMMRGVKQLNELLQKPLGPTATVRGKYSHEVFFKVATLAPLQDVESDAEFASISELAPTRTHSHH